MPGLTLSAEQIKIAATAIEVGKEFNVPERGWLVAIASGLQESGLRNLAGRDRYSVGWQHCGPPAAGAPSRRSATYDSPPRPSTVSPPTDNPGLTEIKGGQQMTIAQAEQAVPGSAFPSAYAKHETAARAIMQRLSGITGGTTEASDAGCGDRSASGETGNCPATGLRRRDRAEAGRSPGAALRPAAIFRPSPTLAASVPTPCPTIPPVGPSTC